MAGQRRWGRALRVAVIAAGVIAASVLAFEVRRGSTPPIRDAAGQPLAGSVAELRTVSLGGADQWVLIRGHNRTRPVLLFLHGGPGMPAMYLAHDFQRDWERDFVVVHWDRRGAGKSFAAASDSTRLTVSQVMGETVELVEWLKAEFGQERIYLLGHSWGSYLGMLVIERYPEHFAAFVGTGQVSASPERVARHRAARMRPAALEAEDASLVARIDGGGAIGESDLFRYGHELRGASSFWPILRTGLGAPEYGLRDTWNVGRGASRLLRLMDHNVISGPLDEHVLAAYIPVFFFLGRHDLNTPSELAARYLDRLDAPLKGVRWFEHSAHFPFWTESGRFREELVALVSEVEAFWDNAGKAP